MENNEIFDKLLKNETLLNYINVDLSFIIKFLSYNNKKDKVNNFIIKNKDLIINKYNLNKDNFLNEYDQIINDKNINKNILLNFLVLDNELLENILLDANKFEEYPNLFMILITSKNINNIINKLKQNNSLLLILMKLISTNHRNVFNIINKYNLVDDFFKFLIEKNHFIINENKYSFVEKKIRYNFLSSFKTLPKYLENYIKEEEFKNKFFMNKNNKELIDIYINSRNINKLISIMKNISTEELNYLYSKLNYDNIKYNFVFYSILPEEIRYKLLDEVYYSNKYFDEKLLNNFKKDLTNYFLHNVKNNLRLISHIDQSIIRQYFVLIRESILNNSPISKQGLKYFLVKNKSRLDKELIEYSLNKYPKLFNSLKIKIEVNFKSNYRKTINLKDIIYNENISNEELKFVEKNFDKLLKIKFNYKLNSEIENLINKYLNS